MRVYIHTHGELHRCVCVHMYMHVQKISRKSVYINTRICVYACKKEAASQTQENGAVLM